MSNYLKAGKGLKNMFIATVGAIICQVLLVIPFPFVNSIAMVATMVFTILNLMGLWTVGEDIAECKKAFWFTILGWVVNSIANAANNLSATGTSVIGTLFSIGGSALSLAVTYYVCISAASALRSFGAEEAAASGDRAWKIALWTTIASIVASVLPDPDPKYYWSTSCSNRYNRSTCWNGVLYDLLKQGLQGIWGIRAGRLSYVLRDT